MVNKTTFNQNNKMEDLKKDIEKVFALARMQMVNSNPASEKDLIHLINCKIDLYKELDKIPKEKESKK